MALIVGLHFLPIAFAVGFRPFYFPGTALVFAAVTGFVVGAPKGSAVAGFMAAGELWFASGIAVRRDWSAIESTGSHRLTISLSTIDSENARVFSPAVPNREEARCA